VAKRRNAITSLDILENVDITGDTDLAPSTHKINTFSSHLRGTSYAL